MKDKINIAELLKDCPKGMELDCTMYENCTFEGIDDIGYTEILVKTPSGQIRLTKEGCFTHNDKYAKCIIFPKGKTTWEGFEPPCKFKDGDILATDLDSIFCLNTLLNTDKRYGCYAGIVYDGSFYVCEPFVYKECCRLATEEEKEKLFQAIKANGYKWNAETKTLEKLVEPKFKVGDIIQDIDSYKVKITAVDIEDECYGYESMIAKGIGSISFSEQDNWELVPKIKPKFKVGDMITNGKVSITISHIDNNYYYTFGRNVTHRLFIKNQDDWKLVPNKFDITTLKPFDKVLVRQDVYGKWGINFFGFYNYDEGYYYTTGNWIYKQCIPYEGNEYLLDTNNDCDDYYKTWEL